MKLVQVVIAITFAFTALAGLESNVESTVEGISIPNTHMLDDHGSVYRGMAPGKRIEQLLTLGITDVLIFKNQTRNEVDQEINKLHSLGFQDKDIHHIPFKWKDLNMTTACEQTIDALKLIRKVYMSQDRAIFFHCTVGEDRTGHLAGIWQLLTEGGNPQEVFENQMCARGYAAGNSHKPWKVVSAIRKGLSPLFFKMARAISDGELSIDNIDKSVCQKLKFVQNISKCL